MFGNLPFNISFFEKYVCIPRQEQLEKALLEITCVLSLSIHAALLLFRIMEACELGFWKNQPPLLKQNVL